MLQSDAQRIDAYWRKRSEEIAGQNKANGFVPPSLHDVYNQNLKNLKEQEAKRQEEIKSGPYALTVDPKRLPPTSPLVQEAKIRMINPEKGSK